MSALDNLISQQPTQRLGVYFEKLITFWFEQSPDHELLYHGLAIRQSTAPSDARESPNSPQKQNQITNVQNGNTTLGECDFLVFDKLNQRIQHWEVAVKFYLGVPHEQDIVWLGPNLKDRLDKKIRHTLAHQLPLSGTREATEAIKDALLCSSGAPALSGAAKRAIGSLVPAANNADAIVRILWLKGALYQPKPQVSQMITALSAAQNQIWPAKHPVEKHSKLPLNNTLQRGTWANTSNSDDGINVTGSGSPLQRRSHFHCELPRLCWLGERTAREVTTALNDKDSHLADFSRKKHTKTELSGFKTEAPSAKHKASFSGDGLMRSRYFAVNSAWLSEATSAAPNSSRRDNNECDED
jgi:hypothetical protein